MQMLLYSTYANEYVTLGDRLAETRKIGIETRVESYYKDSAKRLRSGCVNPAGKNHADKAWQNAEVAGKSRNKPLTNLAQ